LITIIDHHAVRAKAPLENNSPGEQSLVIGLSREQSDAFMLQKLQNILMQYEGHDSVELILRRDTPQPKRIHVSLCVDAASDDLRLQVAREFGNVSISVKER
jgi:hypothetical protein